MSTHNIALRLANILVALVMSLSAGVCAQAKPPGSATAAPQRHTQ